MKKTFASELKKFVRFKGVPFHVKFFLVLSVFDLSGLSDNMVDIWFIRQIKRFGAITAMVKMVGQI